MSGMTREEAKGFVQGKLDCMNRCDVFDCKGTDDCDGCEYCYSQGNFGEQKKALEMAIADMEKQIPKKPIGTYTDYKCSVCGRRVRSGKGSSSRQRDNFCQRCGQALDWGEEND